MVFTALFMNAQNDDCSGAISLTVGPDFASGAATFNNIGATTDGTLPSCNPDVADNVWFKVIVPSSGNLIVETRWILGSAFIDSSLTAYSGTCGSLTEIACKSIFGPMTLLGQTPGTTLYFSVWKPNVPNGDFKISAYEYTPAVNDTCSGAIKLSLGTNFDSGAAIFNNTAASTDSPGPSCHPDASDNVWFKVVVPPSGKFTVETREVIASPFYDTLLTAYSGTCGTLTEIACNDQGTQGLFASISLTGQTPGETLYFSVWKPYSYMDAGDFKISAYDNTVLSTHENEKDRKQIFAYPNPFKDWITLPEVSDVISLSVTDISGKLIKTIENPSTSIHLGDLKEGIYFITLKMNDGTLKTIKTMKK